MRAVAEICRKSPARYLAKYLTKSIHPKSGNARFFTPSRWFGVSRPLNALVESMTKVIEITVGSYHAVVSKLEEVKHVCDSSESVTYRFKHQYGVGDTCVCYPNSPIDNEDLWNCLSALSTSSQIELSQKSCLPLVALEVVKIRLVNWCEKQLRNSFLSSQGLNEYFTEFANMMRQIILSQSPGVLHSLMIWSARLLDMELLLKSNPYHSVTEKRMISGCIDELDLCMNEIVKTDWC